MKLKSLIFTAAFALALTASVDAAYYTAGFTLQNNSQCVGGTLVEQYSDVQDTGAAIAAKPLATGDCQMLMTGPDQCCSVQYRRSTPKAPAIGSHVFSFEIYQGGTVAPSTPPAGTLTSSFQHWAGVSGPATPVAPTASLVANPNSIVDGEQSLLTWSSTNATSCSGTNFSTGNATSGSVLVSPSQTTTYSVQCINGAQSASAQTTVSVSGAGGGASFSASCRAHPTSASVGEDVLWSSTVTGGEGTYTYSWSGSEGLSGSGNQVFKRYTASGEKTASLTVTYTPNVPQSASTPPPPEPPPPPSSTPPPSQLPIGNVCPALGFVTPISPCSGVWAPTYDTGGCQTGWQCIPLTGGGSGGGIILQDTPTFSDSLFDIFNFESPTIQRVPEIQTVDGSILGATAMTVAHTEGELFTSAPTVKQDMLTNGGVSFTETTFVGRTLAADQTTMNRVCSVLHGAGSTATQIGARGYSSCGNNSNIQFSGGRWAVVSGCTGAHLSGSFSCIVPAAAPAPAQCGLSISPATIQAGQSAILSWTSSGLSSLSINNGVGSVTPVQSGSRVVTPSSSLTYTGTGSGTAPTQTSTAGHTEGELFTSAPTVKQDMLTNGGVSFTETTFVGRTFSADQGTMDRVCSVLHGAGSTATQIGARGYSSCGNNQNFQFSGGRWSVVSGCTYAHISGSFSCVVTSTGSAPTTQCSTATVIVAQPVPEPQTETITVQCENSVQVGSPQCSDGIDNDGDGDIDNGADAGCDSDGDDDEGNEEEEEEEETTQCSDDADNDGDNKVDYPEDPGCTSPQDDDETNTAQQCSDANICRGTDVYHRNVSCVETFVESCPHGCSNGACLPAGGGAGGLILNPSAPIVGSGKTVTISWSAVGFVADSCTLVGTNGDSWVLSGSQGSVVSRPLSSSAEYTLTCTDGSGNRVSKRITVKVSPRFEEI